MTGRISLFLAGLLAVFGLAGCATSGDGAGGAQTFSERWQGRSADRFFAEYGSPFAEYGERNGGVRYTWRKRYTAPSAPGSEPDVRVCEIDLVTDSADRIQTIGPTRNSKIRSDETPSCDGVLGTDVT